MSWLFGTCQQCLMSLWFLPLWVIIFFWVSRRICYFSQRLDHSYPRMSDDLHFICQSKSQDHLRSKGRQVDCMMCMKRKWGCWLTSEHCITDEKEKTTHSGAKQLGGNRWQRSMSYFKEESAHISYSTKIIIFS